MFMTSLSLLAAKDEVHRRNEKKIMNIGMTWSMFGNNGMWMKREESISESFKRKGYEKRRLRFGLIVRKVVGEEK